MKEKVKGINVVVFSNLGGSSPERNNHLKFWDFGGKMQAMQHSNNETIGWK